MNDIVIPYLKNNSGELDACIALIKKNVPHRNIYVVEDFEKIGSFYSISHINQILKLKWAIENLDITDDFYLFNDDFFVLEPVKTIPYMHRGTLAAHIDRRRGNGSYTRALKSTQEWLGEDALSYEVHAPFMFNKSKLAIAIAALHRGIGSGKCPLIRSWYGNIMEVGGIRTLDFKNPDNYTDKTFLSTTEQSFRRGIGDYIRSKI